MDFNQKSKVKFRGRKSEVENPNFKDSFNHDIAREAQIIVL